MNKIKIISLAIFILVFLIHCNVEGAKEYLRLKVGNTLPEVRIPAPKSEAHRKYLGLTKERSFSIQDIDAKVVIIQFYRYGCSKCQSEAPTINKLYRYLVNNRKTKGKVKIIGIAAGDDIYYVNFFAKEFKVQFPLFPDKDLIIHEKLGVQGTPIFICVEKRNDGNIKVFHTHIGAIKHADKFLKLIIEKSGLK